MRNVHIPHFGSTFHILLVFATASVASQTNAFAQDLRHDWVLDGSVIGGGVAAAIGLELAKPVAAKECRWCAANSVDERVRDALVWSGHQAAATTSDILLAGGVPALAFGVDATLALHDGRWGGVGVDALIIAEAGVLAIDATQIAKLVFARQRPCAHFPEDGARRCNGHATTDDNVSFFSGHSSTTTALAVATGTVAQMRGYRWAPLAWATLTPVALGTAYLRIAADEHWFTDVLVGVLVGAGIGAGVPYLFHRPEAGAAQQATGSTSAMLVPVAVGGMW